MARITVEDCLEREENRFDLVHLAALRVKQILKGSRPLIREKGEKPVVVALREIAAGKAHLVRKPSVPQAPEELPAPAVTNAARQRA